MAMKLLDYCDTRFWRKFLLLFLLNTAAYYTIILASKRVDIDAQLILPLFGQMDGVLDYFRWMGQLKTYDIQPVRDFTLWLDWLIYQKFHVSTFIFQNILHWTLGCCFVHQLLKSLFPTIRGSILLAFTTLFAVYPLFCATVSWGMARKHILAFMLIVPATNMLILWAQNRDTKKRHPVFFSILYTLSVFSQPITVLWPVWATLYLWLSHPKDFFRGIKWLVPSFVILLVTYLVNSHYYAHSLTFKLQYESKTLDPLNIPDKVLGLGHYVYQLAFPYLPSIHYELGHFSIWIGLLILMSSYLLGAYLKISRAWLGIWFSFMFFPLAVVLMNPNILSDNYLLTPAVAGLVLLITIYEKIPKAPDLLYAPLLIFFIAYTHSESRLWLDPLRFAEERGFARRPNCSNAQNLARKSYALGKRIHSSAKDYLQRYDCFNINTDIMPPGVLMSFVYLQTSILYYEEDIPRAERIKALEKYSKLTYFPKLVMAAMLLKDHEFDRANELISEVVAQKDKIAWSSYYEPIIAAGIHPYCVKTSWQGCLEITNYFTQAQDVPYY